LSPGNVGVIKRGKVPDTTKENIMKRFALTTMLAGSIFAGLIGTAGAAHADLSDVIWNQQQQQRVWVPHVDTSVHAQTTIVRR
jgi:hypothetical protein